MFADAPNLRNKARQQHRELRALLFARRTWVRSRPLVTNAEKMPETGPTVYCPYQRRLECLTGPFADVIVKAAHSPQLF